MPRLRRRYREKFTQIDNQMLTDENLGYTERGLLTTMLSKPDNWNFTIETLCYEYNPKTKTKVKIAGKTKVSSALKKLIATGYLIRRRIYTNGKISDWEYIVSDTPMNQDNESNLVEVEQESDNQDTENLESENLNQEVQQLENSSNNIINNKQILNNKNTNNVKTINQSHCPNDNTVESVKKSDDRQMDGYISQKAVYTDVVKQNVKFPYFAEWLGDEEEAEEIVQMIVRRICSRKATERICGQDFPREVVKSAMLKVDIGVVENAIEQMNQIDNVRNVESYLISTLFNEANGKHLKENSESRWAEYAVKRDYGGCGN